jgi:NAD(P)-dependent dehydrogenase (short-subunit alcohol dehydrogenase family)
MLTRVMASEWGSFGIRVNCVAPGMTATEASKLHWQKQNYDPSAASRHSFALERYGEMREVSQAIVFFASDAASYITGETLAVGGGPKLGGMVSPDSDVSVPSPQTATL